MNHSELPEFIRNVIHRNQAPIAHGFDRIFLYEFEQLERHLQSAEEKFLSDAVALKQRIQDDVESMSASEINSYNEFFVEEMSLIIDRLPRLQWFAQFLVVYASFEYSLSQLCRIVQKRSKFSLSELDFRGRGIRRSAAYLSKIAGVNIPFQSLAWEQARLLGEIRNVIAHANGLIDMQPQNPKSLYVRSQKLPGLSFIKLETKTDRVQFELTSDFIRAALISLQTVLEDVANYELYG